MNNNHRNTHALCAVAVIALGMVGLYVHLDYSGWVLFVGILWAFAA